MSNLDETHSAWRRRTKQQRIVFASSSIFAFVVTVALTLGPLLTQNWWSGFRNYFSNDQLSYASIATNVAHGNFSTVEPLTATGVSHYPSLWYYFIGFLSWLTHLSVPFLWTILGIAIVSAAVFVVGFVAVRISGISLVPILPALALLTGTLSFYSVDYWYTPLQHHAVLWAPYASLFTLNGEVAGISLSVIATSLLVDATVRNGRSSEGKGLKVEFLVVASIIGLLANLQTYTFLSITLLVAVFVAARDQIVKPSRIRIYLSAIAFALVMYFGPEISQQVGPLPLFALLFVALAPLWAPPVWRARSITIPAIVIAGLLASPQLVRTAIGIRNHDPFLTYREASSSNLGILEPATLIASITWILLFITVGLGLWRGKNPALSALVIALGTGFIVMSSNDLWGFNQEPYRSWIQFAILSALLLMIPLAWSISRFGTWQRDHKTIFIIAALLTLTCWVLGLRDVSGFWKYASKEGVTSTSDSSSLALKALTENIDGLVLPSACINPQVFKIITGKNVPTYNLGLAWPENIGAINSLIDAVGNGTIDAGAVKNANVKWIVTDSACPRNIGYLKAPEFAIAGARTYESASGQATLTLWQATGL